MVGLGSPCELGSPKRIIYEGENMGYLGFPTLKNSFGARFLGFGAPSHQAPPGTSHPSLVMNEAEEIVR